MTEPLSKAWQLSSLHFCTSRSSLKYKLGKILNIKSLLNQAQRFSWAKKKSFNRKKKITIWSPRKGKIINLLTFLIRWKRLVLEDSMAVIWSNLRLIWADLELMAGALEGMWTLSFAAWESLAHLLSFIELHFYPYKIYDLYTLYLCVHFYTWTFEYGGVQCIQSRGVRDFS